MGYHDPNVRSGFESDDDNIAIRFRHHRWLTWFLFTAPFRPVTWFLFTTFARRESRAMIQGPSSTFQSTSSRRVVRRFLFTVLGRPTIGSYLPPSAVGSWFLFTAPSGQKLFLFTAQAQPVWFLFAARAPIPKSSVCATGQFIGSYLPRHRNEHAKQWHTKDHHSLHLQHCLGEWLVPIYRAAEQFIGSYLPCLAGQQPVPIYRPARSEVGSYLPRCGAAERMIRSYSPGECSQPVGSYLPRQSRSMSSQSQGHDRKS